MTRLVVGTKNRKKLAELTDLLGDLPCEIVDLAGWPEAPEVEETGSTFAENARLKAVAYARYCGEIVLAEDSGLAVPALGGDPGIFSARYAGGHGDDAANNAKLLEALEIFAGPSREAYYVCAAALADSSGNIVAESEGRCWGRILNAPRGSGGFGYDPLFEVSEYHATFGELSLRVKQALSHRSRAVLKLRPAIRRLIG